MRAEVPFCVLRDLFRIQLAMPHIPSTFPLFLAGALILLFIPGPAVFYILSRSIGQGRKAGVVSAAGISIVRVKDGRFIEAWQNWDAAGLAAQLSA